MKALLMHRDRDFNLQQELPWNAPTLLQDLELTVLLNTMAGNDEFLFGVAKQALLSGFGNDADTVLYRQEILKDCLASPAVVRQVYGLMGDAIQRAKKEWWGLSSRYPDSTMYSSIYSLEAFIEILKSLRDIAEEHAAQFHSEGFTALFAMLRKELSEPYLETIRGHLGELKFRKGVLLSAELGESNESVGLSLRKAHEKERNWLERILKQGPPAYTFYVESRDEVGARIVSEMRQRGIARAAVALAESSGHVLNFFKMLQVELGFYIACLNLHERLAAKNEPVCFPTPAPPGERKHSFRGLYDVCLSLRMDGKVVGNGAEAGGRRLIIVTGANRGGKSTFLRSIGLAQIMMQCGMFVGAENLAAEMCPSLLTHYKREEDTTMKSGKFDEEMARMSQIAGHIEPNSLLLFNESFAATNEREGSEIARQIVSALLEKRAKIFYVTHLYEFARNLFERQLDGTLFLRAERMPDGTRTFRVVEGEPLETSYGKDLYRKIFAVQTEAAGTG